MFVRQAHLLQAVQQKRLEKLELSQVHLSATEMIHRDFQEGELAERGYL